MVTDVHYTNAFRELSIFRTFFLNCQGKRISYQDNLAIYFLDLSAQIQLWVLLSERQQAPLAESHTAW